MAKRSFSDPLLLEVEGWTDANSSSTVPQKKLKLSLKKGVDKENRFNFIDEAKADTLSKKFIPRNTGTCTKWCVATFQLWQNARNVRFQTEKDKQVPSDILNSTDSAVLAKWFSVYVAEVRKKDGTRYPPKTVYALLTGLLRYMRSLNPRCPNFLDTSDVDFSSFHNALDNVLRELRCKGVGAESRPTEAFTPQEEDTLWESGVLCCDNPKSLLQAVFYLNGNNFCLRGGEEQRLLKCSQFERLNDPPRYVYTENASKNRSGGLVQIRVKNKVVPIVSVPEAGSRCHVFLLDKYFSKLPPEAIAKDVFYVKPRPMISEDPTTPWFTAMPIGKNILVKLVKDMCKEANLEGNKTNHSLRATGVSSLFQAGVPEKLIQQRSGHLSLDGLRQYQRTTLEQEKDVSGVLASAVAYRRHSVMTNIQQPQMNFSSCNVTIYNGYPPSKAHHHLTTTVSVQSVTSEIETD